MKKNTFVRNMSLALVFSLVSQVVLAHPGHDHSDPSSSLIHLLWLAPIALAAGIFYWRKLSVRTTKQDRNEDQT